MQIPSQSQLRPLCSAPDEISFYVVHLLLDNRMYFSKLVAVASFVSMSFAIPLIMRDNSNSSVAYFTTLAGHSSSPINQKTVNANGYSFWIGKPTSSSCPDAVASGGCPEGNKTVIEVNAMNGTCVMVGNGIPPSQYLPLILMDCFVGCRSSRRSSRLCCKEWIPQIHRAPYRKCHTGEWHRGWLCPDETIQCRLRCLHIRWRRKG